MFIQSVKEKNTSIVDRLFRTFRAIGIGQLVYFLTQIAAIPILISAWGRLEYGEWILLASVPGYLTVADFGFGFAVANDVAMREARGDDQGALASLQSAWLIVCGLCLLFALSFSAFVLVCPFWRYLQITKILPSQCKVIALLLMVQMLCSQLQGVVRAPLRCGGNTVFAVRIKNLDALAILSLTLLVAVLRIPPVLMAAGMALISLCITLALGLESCRRIPWVKFGFQHASKVEIKMLTWPAISQNLFPLSYALSLQGALSVIGTVSGPVQALIFSTTRTMTRTVNQLTNTVEGAFLPEISTTVAKENLALARKLHHRASQLSFWISVVFALALRALGPTAYHMWTRDKVQLNIALLDILLVALIFNGLYYGSWAVVLATNKHKKVALRMFFLSVSALPAMYLGARLLGIPGVAGVIAFVEFLMLLYVVPSACEMIGDNVGQWLRSVISINFRWLLSGIKSKVA